SRKKRCVKFCPTRNKSIANSSSQCSRKFLVRSSGFNVGAPRWLKPELRTSTLQHECHRAVVNELHLHHRAKYSSFDFRQMFAQFGDEMLVEWNRLLRTRRLHEIWTPPFACVAVKRELRNHQRR